MERVERAFEALSFAVNSQSSPAKPRLPSCFLLRAIKDKYMLYNCFLDFNVLTHDDTQECTVNHTYNYDLRFSPLTNKR